MGRPPQTQEQFVKKFWAQVDKNGPIPSHRPELGPCWLWLGTTDKDGYGRIEWMGSRSAHRASWILKYGAIPESKMVLHHCDNPPCANDGHLFLGSAKDNCQDSLRKGRNYIGEKNAFFGRHHTEEARGKLRVARLGKRLSPEHAQQARTAAVGKIHSPKQRLRHSAATKKRWADGGKEAFKL